MSYCSNRDHDDSVCKALEPSRMSGKDPQLAKCAQVKRTIAEPPRTTRSNGWIRRLDRYLGTVSASSIKDSSRIATLTSTENTEYLATANPSFAVKPRIHRKARTCICCWGGRLKQVLVFEAGFPQTEGGPHLSIRFSSSCRFSPRELAIVVGRMTERIQYTGPHFCQWVPDRLRAACRAERRLSLVVLRFAAPGPAEAAAEAHPRRCASVGSLLGGEARNAAQAQSALLHVHLCRALTCDGFDCPLVKQNEHRKNERRRETARQGNPPEGVIGGPTVEQAPTTGVWVATKRPQNWTSPEGSPRQLFSHILGWLRASPKVACHFLWMFAPIW